MKRGEMGCVMRALRVGSYAIGAVLLALPSSLPAQQRSENVVLIVTDGLRWQELFRGAERRLISRAPGGVPDTTALLREFWREDVAERRRILFPFLWGTVATQGVLIGDQDHGSVARITNKFRFSYPGYSELFTGWYDERIDSNEYPPNPNVTVFEWLSRQRGFEGKVAAIATWDAFARILNAERSGIRVMDGWKEPFTPQEARDPLRAAINELYRTTVKYWPGNAFDAPMQLAAKEYIRLHQPRVLFIGYGETDEWAHAGRYDLLLQSAHQIDAFIGDLWSMMQQMRQYRGRTTFIITVDHGRGGGESDWRSHGERIEGAQDIWIAMIGPDTPALGSVQQHAVATQAQVASTIAGSLGLEQAYRAAAPRAAPSVRALFGPPRIP
jgi:hypothetical protein